MCILPTTVTVFTLHERLLQPHLHFSNNRLPFGIPPKMSIPPKKENLSTTANKKATKLFNCIAAFISRCHQMCGPNLEFSKSGRRKTSFHFRSRRRENVPPSALQTERECAAYNPKCCARRCLRGWFVLGEEEAKGEENKKNIYIYFSVVHNIPPPPKKISTMFHCAFRIFAA